MFGGPFHFIIALFVLAQTGFKLLHVCIHLYLWRKVTSVPFSRDDSQQK